MNNTVYSAECEVYVTIFDGVYYLKNQKSNYYLHVKGGKIKNYTDVIQEQKYNTSESNEKKIRQMWKIKYLGEGKYSIRPMHKLNMGLEATGSNADIFFIGITDTLSGLADAYKWTIDRYSNTSGFIFKINGLSTRCLCVENESTDLGASVKVGSYSTDSSYRWELTKITSVPVGVLFYNNNTYSQATSPVQHISVGDSRTLAHMNLVPAAYSGNMNSQLFTWYSSDTSVVTVISSTGKITGVSLGTATITGVKFINGINYYLTFNVKVIPLYESGTEDYHGYAGVVTSSPYRGISANLSLPVFDPYVADSGESVWISTSADSLGRWVQIGARFYESYNDFQLYYEIYDESAGTMKTHEAGAVDQETVLQCKIEKIESTSKWKASCNGVVYASKALNDTNVSVQTNGEVHKKYIQMGAFTISSIKFKNLSGNWINSTITPHADDHYAYGGSNQCFSIYGPVS